MIRLKSGSFAVLLSLLLCSSAFASSESVAATNPSSRTQIEVRVTLDNHRSVGEQLRVDLFNSTSAPTGVTFTDSIGRAWFHIVEPGEYHVRVSGQSIQSATSSGIVVDESHRTSLAQVQVKPR